MSSRRSRWHMIWNIPRLMKKSWLLLKNPAVPGGRKLLLILLALGYLIWPFDFIPDIPIIGQVDDLGVIFLLLNWFVNKPVPNSIDTEYYFVDEDKKEK